MDLDVNTMSDAEYVKLLLYGASAFLIVMVGFLYLIIWVC